MGISVYLYVDLRLDGLVTRVTHGNAMVAPENNTDVFGVRSGPRFVLHPGWQLQSSSRQPQW